MDRYVRRLVLFITAASLAAHLLLWIELLPVAVRAALLLFALGIAPGVLVVEWLLGADYGDDDSSRLEKWLYGVGAGYLLLITTALAMSYLPGGVAGWQVLLPADIVLVGTAVVLWRRAATFPEARSFREGEHLPWPDRRSFWVSVLLMLIAGALLRLPNLGYSEFQGDEARVMLRASEVIEGYENALFAHATRTSCS